MSSISVLFKRGSLFNFKFPLQDTLLISGPKAGGGLMLLPAARWPFKSTGKILDSISTTGIYFADGKLIRSLQHNEYACLIEYGSYKNPKLTISEKACDVHDVLVRGEETVIVSTGSNEIVRFDSQGEVSTVFKAEGEGDAWHLNCLDVWKG